MAVSCCTAVTFKVGVCGDTRIDFSVTGCEILLLRLQAASNNVDASAIAAIMTYTIFFLASNMLVILKVKYRKFKHPIPRKTSFLGRNRAKTPHWSTE